MAAKATEINVLAELERNGIAIDWASSEEIRVLCPFHEDSSPSCNINVQKRMFVCRSAACGKSGDFISWLARKLQGTRAEICVDLATRYNLEEVKVISPEVVERYHKEIWKAGPLLNALYARGVTDEMIRKYRFGVDGTRITIPIKNASGSFVNVRKYLPGAPGPEKMRNTRGHSKIRLFPIEQLEYERIVLCGGECKAIVAAEELNAHGIGAITATGGEGNWDLALTPLFVGKYVYGCLDIDDAGKKAVESRLMQLHRAAAACYRIDLPLDPEKYPKGDINDYVATGGKLYPLIDKAHVEGEWKPPVAVGIVDCEPVNSTLEHAIHAGSTGKRISLTAVVTAVGDTPYVIPKNFKVLCDRQQRECAACAVFAANKDDWQIHKEHPAILEMVDAPTHRQRESVMKAIDVPPTCRSFRHEAVDYYNCEETRVSPELEITSRTTDRVMVPAICTGDRIELNEPYELVGRMYPNPKTQQATLLISGYRPTQDALSTYKIGDAEPLKIFRPDDWSVAAIQRKLDSIYQDLEANVTRIYKRRDMHLTIDLAYHSPLLLNFDGKKLKGWVEVLILGDSAQGKSDATEWLSHHYNLGRTVECKNATVAGLLGGMQMLGSRWFVTWGIIPNNDRQLVIMEELKGIPENVFNKLTDMRSRGIAETAKIEKRKTHARTRLIVTSNCVRDKKLSHYNFGVEAVLGLIGAPEDVRRFDMVCLVSERDIQSGDLDKLQSDRPNIPHTYTGDLCRSLILWGWTRTEDQVEFEPAASRACLELSTRMTGIFNENIPIVDKGSMRLKLARLAAALAVRTFSASDDGETVIVRPAHVEYVAEWLSVMYSTPTYGYVEYSRSISTAEVMLDVELVKKAIETTTHPNDLAAQLLNTADIDVSDIQDWCGFDNMQAKIMLSLLVRKRALRREQRHYRKSSAFIEWLKDMQGKFGGGKPAYLKEETGF